jgi:hypothetical protein
MIKILAMQQDKKTTPAKQKITDEENAQADSKSAVREGQGNSSILHDNEDTTDRAYPEINQKDRQYKGQDEYAKKKSNNSDDDE